MKNRVSQLASGIIKTPKPEIRFSVDRLDGTVAPDRVVSISVDMTSENRVPIQAFFTSTNPRVRVSKNATVVSAGKMNVEVDTTGLAVQDEIRGSIDIVFNGGEASLPYRFAVGLSGNQKQFRSLKEFSEYASSHFDEAVSIFTWKEFLMMGFMHDFRLYGLYKTYYTSLSPDSGMREFLTAAGVPLPEEEKREQLTVPEKKAFVRSRESIERITLYRMAEYFLDGTRRAHLGRSLLPVRKEIAKLMKGAKENVDLRLLYAYLLFLDHDPASAKEELYKIQDAVTKDRLSDRDRYVAFLALSAKIQEDPERIDKAAKLCHKYFREGTASFLMSYLEYKLNPDLRGDPEAAKEFLWQLYQKGMKYASILQENAFLISDTDVTSEHLTEYELRTLLFGLRNGLLTEKKLFMALSTPLRDPALLNLYVETLKAGYRRFGNAELLHALVNVFLQKKCVGPRYYEWYREAVERRMTIRGLYEYFMASMPKSVDRKLPEHLVSYFGYQKEITGVPLATLYDNVLTYYEDDPDVMDLYGDKINAYALRCADEETYSLRMESMFRRILKSEYVNERTSSALLKLFYLRRIETERDDVKRVVLYYPEFDKEDSYELEDGHAALAPVFSTEAVISFVNGRGEPKCDPNAVVAEVFPETELKRQCALYAEESLLFRLNGANEIVKKGVLREEDLMLVTELIRDKRISPFYRTKLYETVIDLSLTPGMKHVDCSGFLSEADFSAFPKEYKTKLLGALISDSKFELALSDLLSYGATGLSDELLLKLLEATIDYEVIDGNATILAYCYRLYSHDTASSRILEFLAKHFNGSADDMVGIAKAIRRKKLPMHDLLKRTMTTLFYTGKDNDLDMIFDWYLSEEEHDETVIRAYLVLRSHQSFMEKRKMSETCVKELKKRVVNLPRIGFLALMKYYAERAASLTNEERKQVEELVEAGIAENVVPKSFETLREIAGSPFELENRVFVELTDETLSHAIVYAKRFPDNAVFHREMTELYPGSFVQSFLLFQGEWLEVTFLALGKNGEELEIAGPVLSSPGPSKRKNTMYADLLHFEKKIGDPDARETAESLKTLLVKEELAEEIFRR